MATSPTHRECPTNAADIDTLILGSSSTFRTDLPMLALWACTDLECPCNAEEAQRRKSWSRANLSTADDTWLMEPEVWDQEDTEDEDWALLA